jgi:autotransporter-associated beta strand protein
LGTWTNKWLTGISARILEGGAVIDTAANTLSIKQPLVSGALSDGGLTKKGTGTLCLLSTNSYNGPTVIENGMLVFDPQTDTQTVYNVVTCACATRRLLLSIRPVNGTLVLDLGLMP